MNLLLDTHFVIWLATDNDKIRVAERTTLADPENAIHVSVLSLWEIRIKWQTLDRHGHRKGEMSPESASRFAVLSGFKLASLAPDDVIEPLDPPLGYRDPFDEMLLVHARRLGGRLLTRDSRMIGHPLALQP